MQEATTIAELLDRTGFTLQALDTRLIVARLHLERGAVADARAVLDGTRTARSRGPVALRVRAWHAEALLRVARVEEGDLVVIIAGSPPGIPGSTNALRIHRMGDAIHEVAPAYRRTR